jgi:formylglycine-generating enzyme
MVLIDHCYCIDSTEVTRDQYSAWLDTNPSDNGQPPECSWNTGVDAFKPTCGWPPSTKGQYPVVCVDWCDAYAFCKGVGKRLCGRIGTGANSFDDCADATKSQWFKACSSNGVNAYPYGNTYQEQTCNGVDHGVGAAVAAGSMPGCKSSVPGHAGVYDLSGNVWEWEDSCAANIGSNDSCHMRGDSYYGTGEHLRCDLGVSFARSAAYPVLGFRCCAP